MRKKASAKGSTKRDKKAAKIADLPVRSVRGGEAAAAKGGAESFYLKVPSVLGES